MEYRSVEIVSDNTLMSVTTLPTPMSTSERLGRWATVLEAHEGDVCLLNQLEYQPTIARQKLREDQSPLSLAFADPVLRFQGLDGETFGEGRRFFRISMRRMHRIVCTCFYFSRRIVPAKDVAEAIREAETSARQIENFLGYAGISPVRAGFVTALMI